MYVFPAMGRTGDPGRGLQRAAARVQDEARASSVQLVSENGIYVFETCETEKRRRQTKADS